MLMSVCNSFISTKSFKMKKEYCIVKIDQNLNYPNLSFLVIFVVVSLV